MKKCPNCDYPNSDNLVKCFKCKEDLTNVPSTKLMKSFADWMKVSVVLLIFVLGLVLIFRTDSSSPPDSPKKLIAGETVDSRNKVYAVICVDVEESIKKQLLYPPSAKFPVFPDEMIYEGEGLFKVSGYFNTQNVFGAMVRNKYVCEIYRNETDSSFIIVSLSISE